MRVVLIPVIKGASGAVLLNVLFISVWPVCATRISRSFSNRKKIIHSTGVPRVNPFPGQENHDIYLAKLAHSRRTPPISIPRALEAPITVRRRSITPDQEQQNHCDGYHQLENLPGIHFRTPFFAATRRLISILLSRVGNGFQLDAADLCKGNEHEDTLI